MRHTVPVMPRTTRLSRIWGEVWRVLLAALVGAAAFILVVISIQEGAMQPVLPWLQDIDPLLGLASLGLLLLRRRWPLAMTLGTTGLAAVASSAGGASLLVFISLCTRRQWREIVIGAGAVLASGLVWEWLHPAAGRDLTSWVTAVVFQVLAVAAGMGIGLYIGGRREHINTLHERAETAEREQASRIAEARVTERARIAREMHDVLAHRISLIAMHSGALAYREDLPREQVRETAALLRDNADRAVQELRTVLGVLRGTDGPADPLVPQPDLTALEPLVEEARAAGTEVLVEDGLAGGVPDAASRTAYRIIQEGLTNARKHAPGMPVLLRVTGSPEYGVEVLVRNDPAPVPVPPVTGSGMGLVGLTERAVLSGGRLSYGTDRAGRFVLRAWIPWEA